MRISTNQIFQRGLNNMLAQQATTMKLQQQLSSLKRIQSPSDDPISAAKIDLMKQRINMTERLQQNRDAASGALSFEESVISNIMSVAQRIREIQVQAGNSALSEEDRRALSEEVQSLLGQLQGLANTQDSNGYYLFSGSKTSTQTFTRDANGEFIYNGDDTQRFQAISSGLQVAINDNGADLFMRILNGNGHFTVGLPAIPNTGSAAVSSGTVVDTSAYIADDYTMQFVLNSQNELVVMIMGTASGSVIPPTGDPDDAPLYQDGATMTFNGVQVTITGRPEDGDSFTIEPAKNESIFSTVSRIVDNLNRPFSAPSEKAVVETENNQLLDQLDSALSNLLAYQAQIGARLNQLDVAEQVNGDLLQTSQETLSLLEDINFPEVAVKLDLQRIYLQAAQQSFARIQGLTVFNYI
ncbi:MULTISPECIES: flagellar hook-associated protein FlgL [unclassified Legionella]|uniref:flagellar hook-associated protein FlgL n=1 Tax=unclassified Legionella TaxID=2622702 RepID=UPI00105438AD|nr:MULTISPECIES: flagellar hook-associated protein FlgL [unclassified Legionella]MDI9819490.1 flagellar hook-associated protein FlgL [Legionella sp. PL877]